MHVNSTSESTCPRSLLHNTIVHEVTSVSYGLNNTPAADGYQASKASNRHGARHSVQRSMVLLKKSQCLCEL